MEQSQLDHIYRDRWVEYITKEGTVFDSRDYYWRDTPWQDMQKIVVHIKDKVHEIEKPPKALGMLHFRWGGQDWVEGKKIAIREWCIGWFTDKIAQLKYIDFKSGELIKETKEPVAEYLSHIHPALNFVPAQQIADSEKDTPWWKFW